MNGHNLNDAARSWLRQLSHRTAVRIPNDLESKGCTVRNPSTMPLSQSQALVPLLDLQLQTFVINLARRRDRRTHIEELCRNLQLNCEIIVAVDGQQLAKLPSSKVRCLTKSTLRRGGKPQGFRGISVRRYLTSWRVGSTRHSQVLQLAAHRLERTRLTRHGHELWAAVGCNLSHQKILCRMEEDPQLEWALVLEDDACLTMPAPRARKIFNQGMKHLAEHHRHWGVVYLGGHISTGKPIEIGNGLVQAVGVYQTHAVLIRRNILQELLRKLRAGFAADNALISWTRKAPGTCFLFNPALLQQPGGMGRCKDSDISVQGAFFCERKGINYSFNPRRRKHDAFDISRGRRWKRGALKPPRLPERRRWEAGRLGPLRSCKRSLSSSRQAQAGSSHKARSRDL